MKRINNYLDLFSAYNTIAKAISRALQAYAESTGETLCDLLVGDAAITSYIGGEVCIIETLEELDDVRSPLGVSVVSAPGAFDDAGYTEDGKYIYLFSATNDAGGDVFFIPIHIADVCVNVKTSVVLTDQYVVEMMS